MDKEKVIGMLGLVVLVLYVTLMISFYTYHLAAVRAAECEARLDVIVSGSGK